MTSTPFDDIRDLLQRLPAADDARPDGPSETPPAGFTDFAGWLARWSGKSAPAVRRPLVAIFAGTHGVAAHGVSALPLSATQKAVDDCASGQAPISRLCLEFDIGLKVFDLALELPTADFTAAAALDEKGCAATMAFGMEALADGTDLLCLGAFGVGGSTSAAAILSALHGGAVRDWVVPAGGAVDARRASALQAALTLHRDHLGDPLEVLRRLGGREFAAVAGAILAARFQSVPVILNGAVALAAAAVLVRLRHDAVAHCLLSAPLPLPRMNELAAQIGLSEVLGKRYGTTGQGPLDGAFTVAAMKAATALAQKT